MKIEPIDSELNDYAKFYQNVFKSICKAMAVPEHVLHPLPQFEPPATVGTNPAIVLNWYRIKQNPTPGCKALQVINETLWKHGISEAFSADTLNKFKVQHKL